jgi:hypothetical protein
MKFASILLILLGVLLQSACSSQAVYTGESFASDSPFRMRAEGEVTMACESARRALLGQGYLIESAGAESVKGRKAYKTEDTQNTFIEMNIVCLNDVSGSTLYATGVLTTYALKKSSSSASVGLSALGSISLPIGQSADSLVKVSEETIDDKDFYKRFFSSVDIILGEMRATRDSTVPLATEPAPQPAAPTAAAPMPAPMPASVQVAPAAAPEPVPAVVAPVAPESASAPEPTMPAPTVPAPEDFTTQTESGAAPVLSPSPAAPAAIAQPTPSPATPEGVMEPLPVREVSEEVLEPFPLSGAPEDELEPFPVKEKTQDVPAAMPVSEAAEDVLEPFPVTETHAGAP